MIRWKNAAAWKEISQAEVEAAALEWLPKPTNCSPEAFALRVVGESMSPRYPPGQIIFIDPAADPRSGDDVVATMEDDQAIFKRLVEEPGGERMLKAINPAWPEPYQPASDACRIIGVVMADMHMRPD